MNETIGSKKIEWYRDTVKWLVAISAGAVLFGTQWAFDGRLSQAGRSLFTLSAFSLLTASACGIFAMFKFSDYAESQDDIDRKGANGWFWRTFVLAFLGLAVLVLVGIQAVWWPPADADGQPLACYDVFFFGFHVRGIVP